MLSEKGVALIKEYEGFSTKPYVCPAGFLTIGYGHVIQKGEKFTTLSRQQADKLLMKDIAGYEAWVRKLCPVPLSQGQLDALTSFTYNLGVGRLKISTLRKYVNDELHWLVPAELMKWKWGGGKPLPGLIKRREAEGMLYAS